MEIQMGIVEAFNHLVQNWQGAMPKDLHEAKRAKEGKRKYQLGERRAKSMLAKYGGGRYEVSSVVTFSEA